MAHNRSFIFKPPSARGQALHQDNLYLQSHPETCIAAWIAIDPCDDENGGLIVIPGSHRNQILCPVKADSTISFSDDTVPLPRTDPDDPTNPMIKVQTVMKPGDVLFFHGDLVHGSMPNTSRDRFRRSLIFHYIPQESVEVARFNQPLIGPDGGEVVEIKVAEGGGTCGEGWVNEGH